MATRKFKIPYVFCRWGEQQYLGPSYDTSSQTMQVACTKAIHLYKNVTPEQKAQEFIIKPLKRKM